MQGLYLHIPFCRSRCAYCDFFSTTRETEMDRYVQALCLEIKARSNEQPFTRVHTIYIGGGTPSLLSPTLLRQILDCIYAYYDVDADAEVTMEMNPDDSVQLGLLPELNRASLGIQAFDDTLLRLIRRRHDSATAIRAVETLQAGGIRNISIDLIYGLPGQTLAQWNHDLDIAFSLGVQHLSAYALSYEDGTALTRWRDEGHIHEVPEEVSVEMYQHLCQRAREAGFEHYEISNFALPGYHSRHNSSYWTGAPYLGFGPGAHSFDGLRTRRANHPNLTVYLHYWLHETNESKEFHEPYWTHESLSDTALFNEAVMCGLRTARGIDLKALAKRFGQPALDNLLHMASPHLCAGRLIQKAHHLRLAEHALMVSDDIMSDLISL